MDTILTSEQEELLKLTRDILGQLRDVIGETAVTPEDKTALIDSIRQLDELFLLVVAGEFNAGKSAFVNALLGQKLQQEGVTPTTSQIHLLKYGPETKQVAGSRGVWIQTAPIDFLRKICIVDTPGTNAIVREHESLTTEFIPRSDLVLFLTSADRPFSESERAFLIQIRDWGKKIVLVINKVDMLASPSEVQQVIDFVKESARTLLGEVSGIFPVSAKLAQQAKAGQPNLLPSSGFEPLEKFIHDTLDDNGRFQLKLLNPLGVGLKLVKRQLIACDEDLETLKNDTQLLDDIQRQMMFYDEDMQRNFQARLSEIDNILFTMEQHGNKFFDEMLRLGRIPDLIRTKQMQLMFEQQVVGDTPREIENRVSELVDWMVEQDLRQWTAVAEHLSRRKDENDHRIMGQSGPREGTLAYDRQRLVSSIGTATRRAVETYDRVKEATEIAEGARTAVVNTGIAGGLGIGLGAALVAILHTTFLDATGIFAGLVVVTFGLLILPTRRAQAKKDLSAKMATLRQNLLANLTDQFRREMRRGTQRIEDTLAPFSRFIRAEQDKINKQRDDLNELEAHIIGIQSQLKLLTLNDKK